MKRRVIYISSLATTPLSGGRRRRRGRRSGSVWELRAMLELWGRTEQLSHCFVFVFFQEREMGYNKLWQSNRLGGVRGDEFFQVQIEATVCLLTSNTQSQASTAH